MRARRRVDFAASGGARASCGCSQTSCMVLTRALAICAVVEARDDLLGRQRSERVDDQRAQLFARGAALRVGRKALLAGERGLQQHLVAERRPLALVLQAQHHHLAVAGGERTVRIDRRVARAGARRRRRAVHRVVERVVHPLDQRFEHRDVDVLAAPGLLAVQERREDVRVRVHAGGDVGDRQARLRRLLLGARDRDEAGLALDQQVVGLLVAVRAVVAVAGDVADDDAGLVRRQRVVRQAEARRRARRQVLHDDVGRFDDQPLEDRLRLRMLDVERQALLRAVGPDEMRREPAHALVVAAREIADAGALDLDDARAEVRELSRRERRGDRVLERDDGDAGQGSHRAASCAAHALGTATRVHVITAVASIVSAALVIARPQPDRLAVRLRLAADEEGIDVEHGPHGPELVAGDLGVRQPVAQQVEQQRRDQRTVDDRAPDSPRPRSRSGGRSGCGGR